MGEIKITRKKFVNPFESRKGTTEVISNQFGQASFPAIVQITPTDQSSSKNTSVITSKSSLTTTTNDKITAIKSSSRNPLQLHGTGLPSFLLTNIQSFGNSASSDKTTELEAILDHNQIGMACLTETWLTDTTKNQVQIGEYTHFSKVRKNTKRASGGVSILVHKDINARELDVNVPDHIEGIWLATRPNWLPRAVSAIIVAGVYYPGSSSSYAPAQEDIIFHLTDTVHQLYQKYANPLFVIMGDFNDLDVKEICDAGKLKQVVNVPTRSHAILDLILTNCSNEFYNNPLTLPSIHTSDHLCVLYKPTTAKRKRTEKNTQPFEDSESPR